MRPSWTIAGWPKPISSLIDPPVKECRLSRPVVIGGAHSQLNACTALKTAPRLNSSLRSSSRSDTISNSVPRALFRGIHAELLPFSSTSACSFFIRNRPVTFCSSYNLTMLFFDEETGGDGPYIPGRHFFFLIGWSRFRSNPTRNNTSAPCTAKRLSQSGRPPVSRSLADCPRTPPAA